jgi:hypothetical protein
MAANKGIAEQIINEEIEEEEGEEVSLEEELGNLQTGVEDIQERFRNTASNLRSASRTPASKAELATFYEDMAGDLLELLKDALGAVSAGFQELGDEEEDEEGEGEEESDEPDDNTVQVYTTVVMNAELFKTMAADTQFSEAHRQSFEHMQRLNEDSIQIFEEQYDAGKLRELAQKRMAEAKANG